MAWARLDDGFHDDPAMLEVGLDGCGLYARGLSYACKHLTDGFLPDVWVRAQVPSTRAATTGVVERLVATGCWIREARGFRIKDFLDYNPSRDSVKAKREQDRKRKAEAGARGGRPKDSTRLPGGIAAESARNPRGVAADSQSPIPSHPIEDLEPGGAMSVVRDLDPPLVDLSVDESGRAAA